MADELNLPEPKLWTLGAPADGKVLTGIKPTAGGGIPVFTAGQVADAILAERERCAQLAVQWGAARDASRGGIALRNFAASLRDGVKGTLPSSTEGGA